MTAQTMLPAPTRPEDEASLRPVPWRRMAWVIWRQHRIALGGAAAFLGGLAVLVWIVGLQLHHAYASAIACHPAGSPVCGATVARFNGMDDFLANGSVLQALPALIGAFVGAPILARELETGTFRYAWTQGLERWRWTLAKLATLGVVVTAAAGAFSVLNTWYFRPYFAAGNQALFLSTASPFASGLFDSRGVAFAAWTLAAFAIGGLAGMLIRRVVPAILATLAAYAGLAFAAGALMRQHYLPPLLTSNPNVPRFAWILSQWGTKGGKHVWAGRVPPMNLLVPNCPPSGPPGVRVPKPSAGAILQCLPHHGAGYTLYTSYQPVSRFWSFQFIEGGWLLALSVLFIAVTVWLVRRRAA